MDQEQYDRLDVVNRMFYDTARNLVETYRSLSKKKALTEEGLERFSVMKSLCREMETTGESL